MKYKLLKDLPLVEAGTEVEISDTNFFHRGELDIRLPDDNGRPHCIANIKLENQKEWLEEVKEPKTIFDLKGGDMYWYLNKYNEVNSKGFGGLWSESAATKCFVTEREAKRNKLLRELATRTDKWLPKYGERYINQHSDENDWDDDECEIMWYHMGLVFRNEEEYNKYMTEEAKDLLFNI